MPNGPMHRALPGLALAILLAIGTAPSAHAVDTVSDGNADLAPVRTLIAAKDYAGALPLLRNLAAKGDSGAVLNLLAFCLRKTGKLDEALPLYLQAITLEPDLKSAREYLGELYVETGQMEKAREQLAVLVRLCPQGCEEREDLETAIKAGAGKKAVPKP